MGRAFFFYYYYFFESFWTISEYLLLHIDFLYMMVMSVDWSCDVLFGLLRRDGKLDAVCRLFFFFLENTVVIGFTIIAMLVMIGI